MGFGQKSFQAPPANFQASRAVKSTCRYTSEKQKCTAQVLTGTTQDISITITSIDNIVYNNNNTLSFTITFYFNSDYTLPSNSVPISLSTSSNNPTGYSNINLSSLSVTKNNPITSPVTATLNTTLSSGTYNWNVNTDMYWHTSSGNSISYSSNSFAFSFTV